MTIYGGAHGRGAPGTFMAAHMAAAQVGYLWRRTWDAAHLGHLWRRTWPRRRWDAAHFNFSGGALGRGSHRRGAPDHGAHGGGSPDPEP